MSDEADALAEAARNRGLRLKRSRIRTPGKPGYGMFGLTDAEGNPVFGIRGKRALRASAEEIADYLRKAEVGDWKASLKEVGGKRMAPKSSSPSGEVTPKAAEGSERASKKNPSVGPADVSPKGEKQAELRTARPSDAEQLGALFALLDHRIDPKLVARNIRALSSAGEPALVIARGKELLGVCGIARTVTPHRDRPVGRITVLVVAEEARRRGFGRMLVEEAERRLAALGCGLIEVTSNDRLREAHAFYRHLGYERTSMRFAKALPSG